MNRFFLVSIAILLLFGHSLDLFSNSVDTETAERVAQNFMSRSRSTSKMVSDVVTERFEEHNSFYVINFREGGWVMVSAENSTVPVLAFSLDGTYRTEDEKPDGFLYLIEDYKEQIDASRKMQSTRSNEAIEMWNQLMVDEDNRSSKMSQDSTASSRGIYTPGRVLLNVPSRGHIAWGQSRNNSPSPNCTPAYNDKCPKETWYMGWLDDCDCDDRAPAGCGAVAMGQIMWYWRWPKSYSNRAYNWNLMPDSLFNGQTAQGNEIAQLLRDCGDASNMTYACAGSFTTSIASAFHDSFKYEATRTTSKSDWSSSVWNDLIRTEIDCERPVLYYGYKANTIDKRHYFIVDGYDTNNPNLFHINFGWRGFTAWHTLNAIAGTGAPISGGSYNYNSGQYAYIGVSPTYPYPSSVNITDVSYTTVVGSKTEEAQQNITLPASGKKLSVESGGNLTLEAGNSITLKPGFHAKAGSKFTAKINTLNKSGSMDISVPRLFWGGNYVLIYVENANSYDFSVKNSSEVTVYQSAGVISSNYVYLWNNIPLTDTYTCRLHVRNNYGRIGGYVFTVPPQRSGILLGDTTNVDDQALSFSTNNDVEDIFSKEEEFVMIYPQENAPPVYNNVGKNNVFTEADVVVYPNPSNGTINIDITQPFAYYNLKIYNIAGILVYESRSVVQPTYSFDISTFVDGAYTIQLEIDNEVVTKKLILAK